MVMVFKAHLTIYYTLIFILIYKHVYGKNSNLSVCTYKKKKQTRDNYTQLQKEKDQILFIYLFILFFFFIYFFRDDRNT